MAHPSTLARAQLARLLSAAVLPVASLLLSTCARDVTAPPAPTELAFIQQPGNVMAGHQIIPAEEVWASGGLWNKKAKVIRDTAGVREYTPHAYSRSNGWAVCY